MGFNTFFFTLFSSEMPKFENNIASLSYNFDGQLLAVASSYTYQEANELLVYLDSS
ncbi:hypothetical protein Hanom_Chr08g00689511 [Helianthus anomalus]